MARRNNWTGWSLVPALAALAGPHLAAQSLWLPASDPVGIARGGAGVAFGRSLEAAALNPALLVTLSEASSAFLAMGQELQSQQITSQSNQVPFFTSDRNRVLPALGAGWKLGDRFALGLKFETAFQRHGQLPTDAPARFNGIGLDFSGQRSELQGAMAISPEFSVGFSVGMTQIRFKQDTMVRLLLGFDPAVPVTPSNPALALAEVGVQHKGTKAVPSGAFGFRYAFSPRWTVAGSYRTGIKTTLPMEASLRGTVPTLVGIDGFSAAPLGLEPRAQQLIARSEAVPGRADVALPSMASLGVRQRVNQLFTGELDARYINGASTEVPGLPGVRTPGGIVKAPDQVAEGISGLAFSAAADLTFGKSWTVRVGLSLDPPFRKDSSVDVLLNGTRTAGFSGGFGYRVWGGELNLGYQFRQTQDRESSWADSAWSASGYRRTGTIIRIESQGHLWSLGFKKSF